LAVNVSVFAVALAAALWDCRTYRIPNWLTLGAAAAGLLLAGLGVGAPGGAADSLKGFLLGGLFLLPFFMLGAMGGGDVKLAAAFGALGGLHFALHTLFVGSILGGLFALCLLCREGPRGAFKRVYQELVALAVFRSRAGAGAKEAVMPYGVFISMGAVVSLFVEAVKITS
jgi:prepilin peptidase CpaA